MLGTVGSTNISRCNELVSPRQTKDSMEDNRSLSTVTNANDGARSLYRGVNKEWGK